MLFNPKFSRAIWLSLIVLSSASFSVHASDAPLSDEERQARLVELKDTINQLKEELKKMKSSRSDLMTDLEGTESKIGELSEKVKSLRDQLENKQSQLNQLHSEREALNRAKKQQLGSVKQHINAAYKLGQQSTLKMLLNQEDPATLSRNMTYFDRVLTAQAEKIKRYIHTIQRLETVEPEIQQAKIALQKSQQEMESKRQDLVAKYADRQRTLAKLEATLSTKDAQLAVMEKDRKDLETLLKKVVMVTGDMQVSVSNRPFKELKGKLLWPTQGKILNQFGSARVANKIRWQGMLIGAGEGSPVYAVHHGRVVFSDYLRGHGLLIIVDHGDGFMSLYAHNQSLFKEIGEWVSAGEQIATVGQSGGQKSAGLYFELRHQGKPTNPKVWLKKSA